MKLIWKQIFTRMPSELFEKKLREKLSKAVISPTPELWNNIEVQLNEGGRRKGFGIWLLLALLLMGSMGALWGFWRMKTSDNLVENSFVEIQDLPAETPDFNSTLDISKTEKKLEIPAEATSPEKKILPPSKRIVQSPDNKKIGSYKDSKQISSSIAKSDLYVSAVLADELSEEAISQVPQHTSQALQESHISSETSSISSREEIGEVAGLQLLDFGFPSPGGCIVNLDGDGIGQGKNNYKKTWSFSAYADWHKDLQEISLPALGASDNNLQNLAAADQELLPLDNPDPYDYAGLNSPGGFYVQSPQKSISVGIMAALQFRPRWSVQAGLEYGKFSAGNYRVGIFATNSMTQGFESYSLVSSRFTQFAYHQLGIPLQLSYKFLARGRSSLDVYAGASLYAARAYSKSITQSANFYDFIENGRSAQEILNVPNAVSDDVPRLFRYNPFNLSLLTGFNYSYHLSDKRSIFIGPQVKFQATPVYQEQSSEINEIPVYLGLRLGVRFAK